ncbi:UNVERIFIED_CONTAM: Alpha-amylase 3, chloroplastic [Sesamum latifolium]|uniref:alpha-amylase n=1 Tax=Sesamum latifolium TaxID=2727402 RepID=A0AAW2WYR1_9LAMI
MSTVATDSLFHHHRHHIHRASLRSIPKFQLISKKSPPFHLICSQASDSRFNNGASLCYRYSELPRALTSTAAAVVETSESSGITFSETFELNRTEKVEGKITIRLDSGKNEECWQLTIGCSLPGTWILHWGVNYVGDVDSEWDQPPPDMRPSGSITIKDYAIETPFETKSALREGEAYYEVTIEFSTKSKIAAINFVLKDDESGHWYQHRGRDFKVPLVDHLHNDGNFIGAKKGLGIWPGALGQLSSILLKPEAAESKGEDIEELSLQKRPLQSFYEEHSVVKEIVACNTVSVSVRHCQEKAKNILCLETDLPGDVVVHWVSAEMKRWFLGSFVLDEGLFAFVFVLKLNENTWLNCKGNDFYIPFPSLVALDEHSGLTRSEVKEEHKEYGSPMISGSASESKQADPAYTDKIINEIRNLVNDISSEKSRETKSKEAHEIILQEIEKLAAEAYSIFRTSLPTLPEANLSKEEVLQPPVKITSGTGSGFEILCQGFNWESHKSGKWYMELQEKTSKLSSLGFTVIWLPPPTDSVSPEGYMPRDLYNLNSRYGNIDQLKVLVKRLHEVGITVLGDVVLNHRCAQHKNQNGVWNIFGGRLNWDDRAIVADDPHFQGRGNKSSGDNFHAAPNIDHSQEFVRKDIREWLCWLREEIGYDGWRLDFVRGFWVDMSRTTWIQARLTLLWASTGILLVIHMVRWIIIKMHTDRESLTGSTLLMELQALERCEYWRLSDAKGKPPGVVGWWPSRAVTFIENHDTGSTQGHWRFPSGKEMQGYAYILTHPGTPSVFYDHIFSEYQSEISSLISVRKRNKIQCRSTVKIIKAERDVYAAMIDEKLAMKIGPGHYEPSNGQQNWSLAIEGRDYKVWEAS